MTGDCHVRFCEGLGVKSPGLLDYVSETQRASLILCFYQRFGCDCNILKVSAVDKDW